jgi:hypothetical protein
MLIVIEPFRRELSEIAAPSRTVNQEGESGHALDQMTYRFALDKDSDVRSFVMSFVDPEILEKQREKEMKAAVQVAEAAIEARAEENSNFDEEEEDEDEEEEEEEEEEESRQDQDKKMVADEPVKTEPMDVTNGSINDEDEIMSDADTTTKGVVLPRSSAKG